MLTIKSGRFLALRSILIALGILMGTTSVSLAQGSRDEPTPMEILRGALDYLRQGQYEMAIDGMYEYLDMVKESKMDRVVERAQDTRYKLATLLISEGRKEEAVTVLKDYVNALPAPHIRKARKMLVACLFDSENYDECIPAVTNALYFNEHPVEVKASRDAFARDEDLFEDEEMQEPDLPYSMEELAMLHFTMAESYYNLGKMEECIEPFTYVVDHTESEQRKGYSIMQMINALIDLQGFDRILAWVPELYKTPARYDIRVNIALLTAAASLFEAGEYDSALPLYRMIMPREELIAYQEQKLREMRVEAGLPPEYGEDLTEDEMLLFGEEDAERTMMEEATSGSALVRAVSVEEDPLEDVVPEEVNELKVLVDTLKEMEPYENFVNFQMAQLYKNVERYWEAVRFFDMVAQAPGSEDVGERSVFEAVTVLMDKLSDNPEAESRAFSFLDKQHQGMYPRLVAYVLTSRYQRAKDWPAIINLRPYIQGLDPTSDVDLMRYDTELNFMQGVAELMSQQYSNAVERFQFVMDEYPGTAQEGNSLFWCGFSYLCLDEHDNAYECFERYTRDFSSLPPEQSLLDEAYYQGGICLFGMDRLEEAKERFSYVIDTFSTNSVVYPDSCNMRGDIYGAEGGQMLDAAVEDYKHAFENAIRASQATYATFKMCDIFKADEQFYGLDYIEEQVNLYLAEWGDRGADIAKALFWLGRTKIQQQRYEEAAESYMQAIVDYGGDLRQDGVDSMIPELVKMCKVFLDDQQRESIRNRLRIAMESTDSEVLRLRLRVTLAKFDNAEVELGKQLITELDTLDNASPPVLSAICEASFELGDFSRSGDLLRTFKYNFEDSQYMRSAFKLHATGQYDRGNLAGALETVIDAQEEYGTEATMAWAQLMKADVLLSQSIMYSSAEPLTPDVLEEESRTQLQIAQDKLTTVNEELAKEKPDEKAKARLLAERVKLNETISALQSAVEGTIGERETRTLLAQCKLGAAREENKNVMGVREWRGEPYAQATYQLGEVEEAAGKLIDAHGYYQRAYFQYKGLGDWAAEGYLAAANVLKQLSEDPSMSSADQIVYAEARINTLKAMLLDEYANESPQAGIAREMLGPAVVEEINAIIASGTETNIVVTVEAERENPETTGGGAGDSVKVEGGA